MINSSIDLTLSFIFEHQKGLTNLAYSVFGVMDFIHVYRHPNLKTTLKVAYIARGFFYVATKAMYLLKVSTTAPFFTANLLGLGLHAIEFKNSTDNHDRTKQTLGMISNVAYMIFLRMPHPGTLSIALIAGAAKIILSAAPLVKKMFS